MKLRLLLAAVTAVTFAGIASAEIIAVDQGVAVRETVADSPNRGMTMDSVTAKFGQPTSRHDTVGQPPITRWDYPGFSVFFERQYVLHSVVTQS